MTELNERVEAARRLFQEGFNCAQAVVGAFYPPEKREGQLALKLASGFGGGMRRGEVCGAVSGAVMVLGMREGYLAGDQAAKLKSSELTSAFMEGYAQRQGTLYCREILGYDPRDAEAAKGFAAQKRQVCEGAIETAIVLLGELGIG
ncbi:MAG: C-GCAxxG-C-C family protein [Bacillota bacterium]|jgi:C_GCAxxG_C_C family probable redox protein|nr:C-GCAxxG-C-C family protein [Bacillota bacterium]HHT90943.1 C_GCAxxG_C_C family protein [Bacillota bacterium]